MCFNAVDRHVDSGRGSQTAVIYDSPVTELKQFITYAQIQQEVRACKNLSFPCFIKHVITLSLKF